jgi:signal transduction histidine kinase
MLSRLAPTGLRARLLLSYAFLTLLTIFLASSGALALYQNRLERDARSDMVQQVETTLSLIASAADEAPIPVDRLADLVFPDTGARRARQPLLFVDAQGTPAFTVWPDWGGFGQNPRSGSGRLMPAPRTGNGLARIRPATFQGRGQHYPPLPPAGDGRPGRGEIRLRDRSLLLYSSGRVPVEIDLESADLDFLEASLQPPFHLVVARPRAELRRLWRSMLPSVLWLGLLALGLALILAWMLARSITRPLLAVADASERMAAGDYSVRVSGSGGSDEFGRLAASFNAMAEAVGQADRRQRDFVANVGHDLRTPLTTVRGFAGALLDGTAKDDAQRQRAAEAITSASERMSQLIESLIELARMEGQDAGLQRVTQSASALLHRVAMEVQALAEQRKSTLAVEADAQLELRIDADWMARALGNAVENALIYSPEGSTVSLMAEAALTVEGQSAVRITVSDHGAGIDPEDLPKVFERFYRADRARRAGRSGLGLAIAREIVEAHGGQIEIESQLGEGTRVLITLPTGIAPG